MQRSSDRVNANGTEAKGDPFIRDAWTKLHVAPAQVSACMYMDMYTVYGYFYYCSKSVYCLSYIDMLMSIRMQHMPQDLRENLAILEACNRIFERGFLSHDKFKNIDSPTLKSIDDGLKFFTNWMDQILEKGTNMFVS